MPRLKKDITTHDRNGVIAIDINHKNISIADINKVGKLLSSKVFKFNFGKNYSADYREQLINKHINTIVKYAKIKNKPIVIESLDFFKKKAKQLKDLDKNYNRMLHTLAYAKIAERIRLACYQEGVGFSKVNAAYSSMLGKTLYSKEYGISVHQAAAYVLARRYYKLEEYYHVQKINFIYKDKACSLTIPEDIFKKQDKIKPTKFHSLLYYWLAKELKAPSRFYQRGTLTSQVVQPTSSHEILGING